MDRIFKVTLNQGFDAKGQSGPQGKEPDFSALQSASARRAFENTSQRKRRESSLDNDNRLTKPNTDLLTSAPEDFDIFGASQLAKRKSANQVQ